MFLFRAVGIPRCGFLTRYSYALDVNYHVHIDIITCVCIACQFFFFKKLPKLNKCTWSKCEFTVFKCIAPRYMWNRSLLKSYDNTNANSATCNMQHCIVNINDRKVTIDVDLKIILETLCTRERWTGRQGNLENKFNYSVSRVQVFRCTIKGKC